VKTKLIKKHAKDCYAVKNTENGSWPYPWAYITDEATYGTKVSPVNARSSTRWRYLRCNCTHCDAELAFREEDILALIHEATI